MKIVINDNCYNQVAVSLLINFPMKTALFSQYLDAGTNVRFKHRIIRLQLCDKDIYLIYAAHLDGLNGIYLFRNGKAYYLF